MTTTLQAHGGGAQPASIDTSGKVAGGAAQRVYGFDSAEAAQAAGYVCEGGPAMSVALITNAQIASGAWKAEGDPAALVVYTAPANMPVEGGYAVPVYPVNGWSSAPAPVAPLFDSAEIGTVNASTLVVTFDSNVDASNYSTGVTIKVNGAATSITSATRQADHAVVYYVIPVLWHGSGDAVTWEYASGSGNIVAESGGAALADVSAQSVTNNCEYAALLDLQADTLVLSDGDPVSLWADQSGQGHNFTQTGTARPEKQTIGTYPAVVPDGVNDLLIGGNFADNLADFSVMIVSNCSITTGSTAFQMVKGFDQNANFVLGAGSFGEQTDSNNYASISTNNNAVNADVVYTYLSNPRGVLSQYLNGSLDDFSHDDFGTVTTFSNNSNIILFATGIGQFNAMPTRAMLIFSPSPSASNRAAIETRLAARYGVTL